ncbi:hypothetical protein KAW64_06080 [bacterium]|nr:hypothetical protein [bacterium]
MRTPNGHVRRPALFLMLALTLSVVTGCAVGRHEIPDISGLPEAARSREADVERLLVQTPAGTWVPLLEVADVDRGRAHTSIIALSGVVVNNSDTEVASA